jgi:hypothetical protein
MDTQRIEALCLLILHFRQRLLVLADEHIRASMDYVVGSDYMGSHWYVL